MSIAVVFIPGFLCDERLFTHQIAALAQRDDVESVNIADISDADSIEAMASAVLAQAPERFALIGMSLGAIVATEVAHTAPERVIGLALLDTNLDAPPAGQIAIRRMWSERVRNGDLLRVVLDDLVPRMAGNMSDAALVVDMAVASGAETFIRHNEALLHRRDRRDDLATLSVPILIACGREDGLCPPHLHHELAARIPRAELVVVDGAGHLSTIDQPAALTGALWAWLTSCHNNNHPKGGTSNEYSKA